jgi:hypothetical protein
MLQSHGSTPPPKRVANFTALRVLSRLYSPEIRCPHCNAAQFCCDTESCNLVTVTLVQRQAPADEVSTTYCTYRHTGTVRWAHACARRSLCHIRNPPNTDMNICVLSISRMLYNDLNCSGEPAVTQTGRHWTVCMIRGHSIQTISQHISPLKNVSARVSNQHTAQRRVQDPVFECAPGTSTAHGLQG